MSAAAGLDTRMGVRTLRQAFILARNDLRQEVRRLELVVTAGFFALVVLVMFAVAFMGLPEASAPRAIPGMLWLSLAFVGGLTLTRVFDRERESHTLLALLAAPVDRLAIYLSKLGVTLVVLFGCGVMLVVGFAFVFPAGIGFAVRPLETACLLYAGCLGFSAIGTIFAAGLATSTGKNVLLSVMLFPLSMPILLFALVATMRVLEGHPDTWATIGQIFAVDLLMLGAGAFVFESVLVGVARTKAVARAHTSQRAQLERPT